MSVYTDFISGVRSGGLTNPAGLAAVAATGQRESGYSPANAYGSWSDPSESGQPGTAGGILSWRGPRFEKMRAFAADAGDDPEKPTSQTQAAFFLQEDPALVEQLNSAGSVEEAQRLMNRAWAFAGHDRPGGEAAERMKTARALLPTLGGDASMSDASGEVTIPIDAGSGSTFAYGSAGEDTVPNPMPENEGGLGGLGGFFQSDGFSDVIRAASLSLLSSPRNAPLSGMATILPQLQERREKKDERLMQQQALSGALMKAGFTKDEAAAYAMSPSAANVAIAALDTQRSDKKLADEKDANQAYFRSLGEIPGIAGGGSSAMSSPGLMGTQPIADSSGSPAVLAPDAGADGNKTMAYKAKLEERGRALYDAATRAQTPEQLAQVKLQIEGNDAQLTRIDKMLGGGTGKYGVTPVPVMNADGTYGVVQLGNDGTIRQPQFPEGVRPYNPEELSASKSRGTAAGKVSGEAVGALAGAETMADRVTSQVESLKNDPYLPSMVGPVDSRIGNYSGDAARVQSKMDQLQGGAFLAAREMLKGGGAITDFEGQKAEAAFARLNAAQSEADYIKALDEFNGAVQAGAEKLRKTAAGGAVMPGIDAAPRQSGGSQGGQSEYRNRYGLE